MNRRNEPERRHHWLIRYYRAQAKFNIVVLRELHLLPPPLARYLLAQLQRTENRSGR
jgi:hypothetical protein